MAETQDTIPDWPRFRLAARTVDAPDKGHDRPVRTGSDEALTIISICLALLCRA